MAYCEDDASMSIVNCTFSGRRLLRKKNLFLGLISVYLRRFLHVLRFTSSRIACKLLAHLTPFPFVSTAKSTQKGTVIITILHRGHMFGPLNSGKQ